MSAESETIDEREQRVLAEADQTIADIDAKLKTWERPPLSPAGQTTVEALPTATESSTTAFAEQTAPVRVGDPGARARRQRRKRERQNRRGRR